ncbi:hypothetical protein RDI58_023053 [Solanum bulbocastanum]|uniref:Uncharacterized protein n=1 Tax=Solanum bulbocastanum TaxID=147425 RepID=A0AAN8T3T5_SOLBU
MYMNKLSSIVSDLPVVEEELDSASLADVDRTVVAASPADVDKTVVDASFQDTSSRCLQRCLSYG